MTPQATRNATLVRATDSRRRQAIIEAACSLFTNIGYEATTIARVAQKAGVAVGTVYWYFASKSDLLFAVKGDVESKIVTFLTSREMQSIPPHMAIRPLIEAIFKFTAEDNEIVQLMGLSPQEIGHFHGSADNRPLLQALKLFFDQAVANGAFRPIDTRVAVLMAHGMVLAVLDECYKVEGGKEPDRYMIPLIELLIAWLVAPSYQEGKAL
jgi:AcrR family transcriptional regulator